MRWCVVVIVAIAVIVPATARADGKAQAAQLQREGNALARAKHYAAAIAKYKAGQRIEFSWKRLCNIGVAYRYMRRLPEAALYLERCKGNATPVFPATMQKHTDAVKTLLRDGSFAPVVVRTRPADAAISFRALGAGEVVASGERVWLPHGKHALRITRAGMQPQDIELDVAGKVAIARDVALAPVPPPQVPPVTPPAVREPEPLPITAPPPPQEDDERSTRRGVGGMAPAAVATGVLALGAGALFHVYARRTYDRAVALPEFPANAPHPEYERELDTFNKQRAAAVGLYLLGATATGIGAYLWRRASRSKRSTSRGALGVMPTGRGAWAFARWAL